jgi:UDP-N-acetylmuramoyl-tripeptide--D-alanyl-D-alanine ligase
MDGETFLVLGDMAELGAMAEALHFESGQYAKRCEVSRLYALGDLSRNAVEGFGEGAKFFGSREELLDELTKGINESTTVLVKGSRSMAMEKVVEALVLDKNNNNKQRAN